jgi:S1-C subfamily serine protease
MRNRRFATGLGALLVLAASTGPALAQSETKTADDLVSAVVQIKTFINPDGRTVENLGREREGTGIVIDSSGLVLTIGYLMVEAHAAELVTSEGRTVGADVVGYDYDTGFGLLRASSPLRVPPMELGRSASVKEGDRLLVAGFGGLDMLGATLVVSKREFAGYWEYLLEEAIFTSPPHPRWSGAALINREGKLVGVGSLIVNDATGKGEGIPGNMFVPIDELPPILAEMIAGGRVTRRPKPWLGLTTDDIGGRLVVRRVTSRGPAEKGGIRAGDTIVGVGGERPRNLGDFYRKLWSQGDAGVTIPLDIERGGGRQRIELKSVNRLEHLKLNSTF